MADDKTPEETSEAPEQTSGIGGGKAALPENPQQGGETEDTTPGEGAGADIPDAEWVEKADLHTGEDAKADVEEKEAYVEEHQPEFGLDQKYVDELQKIEANKREVSEAAIKPLQSTDFEVATPEDEYLGHGVYASQAIHEQEKLHARIRRDAGQEGTSETQKIDAELLEEDKPASVKRDEK